MSNPQKLFSFGFFSSGSNSFNPHLQSNQPVSSPSLISLLFTLIYLKKYFLAVATPSRLVYLLCIRFSSYFILRKIRFVDEKFCLYGILYLTGIMSWNFLLMKSKTWFLKKRGWQFVASTKNWWNLFTVLEMEAWFPFVFPLHFVEMVE